MREVYALSFFAIAFYFLPAIIAAARHTHNATAHPAPEHLPWLDRIGWFVALLMAICSAPYYVYYYRRGW